MKKILYFAILVAALAVSCRPKYEPTWESLSAYDRAPEWFGDAKLGMWAHWGPQCQPEDGDWYARLMYEEIGRASCRERV